MSTDTTTQTTLQLGDQDSGNPSHEILIRIHRHVKTRLLKYIEPDSPLFVELNDQLDDTIFIQMIENDVFTMQSLHALINTIFIWIKRLHAPARDRLVEESKQLVLETEPENIVTVFIQEVLFCLDLLDRDVYVFSVVEAMRPK
jgi:hypothetical protein